MKETVRKGCCFNGKMYLTEHNISEKKLVLHKANEFFVTKYPICVFDFSKREMVNFKLFVLNETLVVAIQYADEIHFMYMCKDEQVIIPTAEGSDNIYNKLMENFIVLYDDILGLNPKYINKEFFIRAFSTRYLVPVTFTS